jgi:hypothetical protein
MKTFIFALVLMMGSMVSAAETTYTVNRSTVDILSSAKQNMAQYEAGTVDLQELGKIKNVDLEIKTLALTKDRYYRFNVRLRSPIGKLWGFEKSLEVWAGDNQTTVRSRVNISYGKTRRFPLRWVNRIKNCVISKIECIILGLERRKLAELTR